MNLQPLKIPSGWYVSWNLLTDIDPTEENIHEFSGSSLLLINSPSRLKAIDVSWRPEADINGSYELKVIILLPNFNSKTNLMEYDGLWEMPELEYSTKNRLELVDKVNELLWFTKPFNDPRILSEPGIVDEKNEAIRLELINIGITAELSLKIINSENKKLQDLLLDHKDITISTLEELSVKGTSKGIRNKALQMLKSRNFRKI